MKRLGKSEISLMATAFVVFLVLIMTPCPAQTSWTKFAGNPVLDSGSGFRHFYQPSVIKENGIYKMWHAVDNPPDGIFYATSPDGTTWTHHPANPVLRITSIPWASRRVGEPTVVQESGIYRMWFDGLISGQPSSIGYAISPDGINWALHGNDPVLVATQPWETGPGGIGEPEVIHHEGLFRMWYSHAGALGYAESADGINWTKFPDNPVLRGVGTSTVVFDGTSYHMWYLDREALPPQETSIGYASSPDGINWTKFPGNPVVTVQTPVRTWKFDQVAWADVVLDGSLLEMWFTARDQGQRYGIGYATSQLTSTGGCGTLPPPMLPIPTGLMNTANGSFGTPFTLNWNHVWTGCGGYEVQYRRGATSTFVSTEVTGGGTVQITIPLPPGAVNNPTSYALRVRSFWGSGNDTKQFSPWSAIGSIEMFLPSPKAITFPQLALGGGFEVVLLLSSKTTNSWTGTVQLREGNDEMWSAPWSLDGVSATGSSAFDVALAPRATQRFLLNGDAVARAGYLSIIPGDGSSTAGISVAFFYNFFAGLDLADSIGVAPSLPSTDFTFPVERAEGVGTGVAFVASSTFPFQIVLTAFDSSGNQVQQSEVTYAGHTAKFFSELFPDVQTGFIGEVQVESEEEISLVVIRFQPTSNGFQLTTLPVITVADASPCPVSWWSADEVAGDKAFDKIGSNHGTMLGGLTTVPGQVGNAFNFDGLDDGIEVPDSPSLDITGNFTIEAWILPSELDGANAILNKIEVPGTPADPSGRRGAYEFVLIDNRLQATVYDNLNRLPNGDQQSMSRFSEFGAVALGSWQHVAVVYDGTDSNTATKLYLNGLQIDTTTSRSGFSSIRDVDAPVRIGHFVEDNVMQQFFQGLVDEIKIYDEALTADQIQSLFLSN